MDRSVFTEVKRFGAPKQSSLLRVLPDKLLDRESKFIRHASDAAEMHELARNHNNPTLLKESLRHLYMITQEAKEACASYVQAKPDPRDPEGIEFLCASGQGQLWLNAPHCQNCVLFDVSNHPMFVRETAPRAKRGKKGVLK